MATKLRDYQYDFVDPLPEECPCPVCLEVQVDPHQVTCCGKIFCKTCLDKLVGGRRNCPNCRQRFVKNKRYFPDVNTERKINQLQVRCRNKDKGCKWVGDLKDLKHFVHILDCPNQLVPCTNRKDNEMCGAMIQRQDLDKHMNELCRWKQVECAHCKLRAAPEFINGLHIKQCPNVLVPCTNNGCELQVERVILSNHRTSCPKQIVSCRYSSVGCKARITRENIVSHNQQCMEQHLDSAVDRLDQTRNKLEVLLKRVSVLEAKSSRQRKRTMYDDDDDEDEEDGNFCFNCGEYHPAYSAVDDCYYDDSSDYSY